MSGLIAGDPAKQWEWHEAHRDLAKNMYRTSYNDMAHGREVCMKSDYPAGYGGHIPSMRHDVLFRNTAFERNIVLRRSDPSRDSFPSFHDQISGIPTITSFPRGAKNNPTYKVVPHDGTTTTPKPPWGVLADKVREPLNYRTVPPTMKRTQSLPSVGMPRDAATKLEEARAATPSGLAPSPLGVPPSPGSRLQQHVSMANEASRLGRMPSESEILAQQMY
uniref:Uncharacterized protein n=1 Tax=Alexandrium andersonii TaxID=327968 RepID=A0A7S2B625_9DINO